MTFVYCYFFDSVYISNCNVHCIMETWLNDTIFSHNFGLPHTQCFVLTEITHIVGVKCYLQSPNHFMASNGHKTWKLLKSVCEMKSLLVII
jgi:hypothetical protein